MKKTLSLFFLILFCLPLQAKEIRFSFSNTPKPIITVLNETLETYDFTPYLEQTGQLKTFLSQVAPDLIDALHASGYTDPKMTDFTLSDKKSYWLAEYTFNLGPQTMIKAVHFDLSGPGKNDMSLHQPFSETNTIQGKAFNQADYNALKNSILAAAEDRGYFQAHLTVHQVRINRETHSAEIYLGLYTGPQYRYGEIKIIQSKAIFDEDFLKGFIHLKTGENFSASDIDTLQTNLTKSGYFEVIQIEPDPDHNKQQVAINVHLKAKKSQQYTLGVGYGTETGPRTLLGLELRQITDTGHHFKGQAQLSQNFNQYSIAYIIPGNDPVNDSISLYANRSFTNVQPYVAHESLAGLAYIRTLMKWKINIALHQYFTEFRLRNNIRDHAKYLIPNLTFSYFDVVERWRWHQGFTVSNALRGASEGEPFSDLSFLQNTLSGRTSWVIDKNHRVFSDVQFGSTAVQHIEKLAPTLRFFAGGIDSVRGYAYKSLGPTDDAGNLMGGKYLFIFNANFERALTQSLSGIIFYDFGQAFTEFTDIDFKKGAGVGLSWQSPVGALRLYFSKALSERSDRWRVDLSLGAFI